MNEEVSITKEQKEMSNKQKEKLIGILVLLKKKKVTIKIDLNDLKKKNTKEMNNYIWNLILENSGSEEDKEIIEGMLK